MQDFQFSHVKNKISWTTQAINFLLNKYIYLFIFTVAEGNKQLLWTVL